MNDSGNPNSASNNEQTLNSQQAPQTEESARPAGAENSKYVYDANKEKLVKEKKKAGFIRGLIRVIIILLVIALGIFLVLLLVAKAGKWDSVSSMLYHMYGELQLMWDRITAK